MKLSSDCEVICVLGIYSVCVCISLLLLLLAPNTNAISFEMIIYLGYYFRAERSYFFAVINSFIRI